MKDDGGPAFPCEVCKQDDGSLRGVQTGNRQGIHEGMTLRDWFAGMALRSIIDQTIVNDLDTSNIDAIARNSYLMADALIRARSQ